MRKTGLSIMFVILFLAMAMIPAISASNIEVIQANDEDGLDNKISFPISEEDEDELSACIEEFTAWIKNNARSLLADLKLTEEEKAEIKSEANKVIDSLNVILEKNGQDPIVAETIFGEIFSNIFEFPPRSLIFSAGRGLAYIPFHRSDAFFGIMGRPMLFFYPPAVLGGLGYSGKFHVNLLPPRIEFRDQLGSHLVITTLFTGLYINIGDLGVDTPVNGIMLVLGRARVLMRNIGLL